MFDIFTHIIQCYLKILLYYCTFSYIILHHIIAVAKKTKFKIINFVFLCNLYFTIWIFLTAFILRPSNLIKRDDLSIRVDSISKEDKTRSSYKTRSSVKDQYSIYSLKDLQCLFIIVNRVSWKDDKRRKNFSYMYTINVYIKIFLTLNFTETAPIIPSNISKFFNRRASHKYYK